MTITFPVFDVGERVIVPPTSGALDPMYRAGGRGVVAWTRVIDGTEFYYVALPGAVDQPQPYRADELQLEPPV